MYTIKSDITLKRFPVIHVKTINEFFQLNNNGRSKIIVIPFEHETPEFLNLKDKFASFYWLFSHTINGFYAKYIEAITQMNKSFVALNEKKLQEASDDNMSKML
jgi:hypothetical protein